VWRRIFWLSCTFARSERSPSSKSPDELIESASAPVSRGPPPASLPRFCINLNIDELGNIRSVSRVKVLEALMRSENQTETLDDWIYASCRNSVSGALPGILPSHGASDAVSVVTFDAESSQCGSQHSR
jgi:hypothetical protein